MNSNKIVKIYVTAFFIWVGALSLIYFLNKRNPNFGVMSIVLFCAFFFIATNRNIEIFMNSRNKKTIFNTILGLAILSIIGYLIVVTGVYSVTTYLENWVLLLGCGLLFITLSAWFAEKLLSTYKE